MGMFFLITAIGLIPTIAAIAILRSREWDADSRKSLRYGVLVVGSMVFFAITLVGVIGSVIAGPTAAISSGTKVAELEALYQNNIAGYKLTVQDAYIIIDADDVAEKTGSCGVARCVPFASSSMNSLSYGVKTYNEELAKQRFNESTWLFWPVWKDAPEYLKPVVVSEAPPE